LTVAGRNGKVFRRFPLREGFQIRLEGTLDGRSGLSLESRKSTALHDPGAEMVDRMMGLWERYGRIALAALAGIVVIGAVAFLTVRHNADQDNLASKELAESDFLFRRGDLERAKTTAQQASKTYPGTSSGTDAHRIAGDAAFWSGNFKDAISEYRAYLEKDSKGLPADCVRRSLAYALDNAKQTAEAAKTYDQVSGAFDRETNAEMLFAAARCDLASGDRAGAIQRLQRIADELGETTYAARARVKLGELSASH
jgi:tetratricopeptide (TPR) repeat protein